jgi:hypothetical protein
LTCQARLVEAGRHTTILDVGKMAFRVLENTTVL